MRRADKMPSFEGQRRPHNIRVECKIKLYLELSVSSSKTVSSRAERINDNLRPPATEELPENFESVPGNPESGRIGFATDDLSHRLRS
jgi:hypothetical protein